MHSKVAVVVGTRPEIIKMFPVVRALKEYGMDFFIIHTGQHYSYELSKIFFEELNLPMPKYNLGVGSGSHSEETGRIIISIEKVLREEKPDILLVEGDTNSILGAALAAVKLHIPVGHVEAGLRSFDRSMPEEINRTITDHVSTLLFAPTEISMKNLLREGIPHYKVYVTGNTIVDAVHYCLTKVRKVEKDVLEKLGIEKRNYVLVTVHRQENVDDPGRFKAIIEGLNLIKERFGYEIIYPIHPRSRKRAAEFNIDLGKITVIDPLGYIDFLALEKNAFVIITDSGGVQEEACILRVPCITVRDNTERPETILVGANVLAGADSKSISDKFESLIINDSAHKWSNPLGDGKAGEHIVKIVEEYLEACTWRKFL